MNIRIVSPSAAIDPQLIDKAAVVLESWGHTVSIAPHAQGKWAGFSGTKEERLADLNEAFADPAVEAILCSRGGYGLAQIIDRVKVDERKLLIGFSDITCLHCLCANHEMPSLHSIMAKHIASLPADSDPIKTLRTILDGGKNISYTLPTDSLSRKGKATGILRGGNLSVFYGLQGTPFEVKKKDTILFIEDVEEPQYHIDRMLQNLRLSGLLASVKGVIFGQFAGCKDDERVGCSLNETLLNSVAPYNIPVIMNFPAGHVEYNLPMMLNQQVEISIDDNHTTFTQQLH